jgi:uridylate kinase
MLQVNSDLRFIKTWVLCKICTMSQAETIVMSVGGSLIVPDAIDIAFLTSLKSLITEETAKGRHFIIITGGGKTARRYADAAKAVSNLDNEDLDWLGIHATRLNGHLLRTIFKDIAHPVMVTNPDDILDVPKNVPLVVASGYRPGASTDLRAVQIAERVGAKKVINLSNIDYVFTDNPNTNPDAVKIEDITWEEFRKLIPETWDPGLSSPFDPIAAKEAQAKNIEVACINGANMDSLANYINGESFIGTKIHN